MKEGSVEDLKKQIEELKSSNSMFKKDLLKALMTEEVLIAAGLITREQAKQAASLIK